jgi:heterodisulfide reductase subunit A-like polyferredoxin
MSEKKNPVFVQCMCRGDCPGFNQLNVWNLVNYVRNELDVEYTIVHPQLCVDDGDRFWKDFAKADTTYIVGGCDPKMQRKMYKDAMAEVGSDFDKQVIPLDLRNMPTEEAMKKVTEALDNNKKKPKEDK